MLPHDEGADGTDQRLDHVQHDLEQEVERQCPGDHLTVVDSLVGEGAGDWILQVQFAHTVLSHLLTCEVTGLSVVVRGERHDQHRNDQADRTQDEVQELQRAQSKSCGFTTKPQKSFVLLILETWLLLQSIVS